MAVAKKLFSHVVGKAKDKQNLLQWKRFLVAIWLWHLWASCRVGKDILFSLHYSIWHHIDVAALFFLLPSVWEVTFWSYLILKRCFLICSCFCYCCFGCWPIGVATADHLYSNTSCSHFKLKAQPFHQTILWKSLWPAQFPYSTSNIAAASFGTFMRI